MKKSKEEIEKAIEEEKKQVLTFVLEILQSKSVWKDQVFEDLTISKRGGVFCIKTIKENVIPSRVYYKKKCDTKFSVERMLGLQNILAKDQLSVDVLASGGNWQIEFGFGQTFNLSENSDRIYEIEMGKLLAKLHKVPTDWFEKYKKQLITRFPCLSHEKDGSSLWPISCKMHDRHDVNEHLKLIQQLIPEPISVAGKRVVTTHGDYFSDNVLVESNGSKRIIDFEFGCVSNAVQDLVHLIDEKPGRRPLIKSYLESANLPTDEDSINDLIFDAVVNEFIHFFIVRAICFDVEVNKEEVLKALVHFNSLMEVILPDKNMREWVATRDYDLRGGFKDAWPWWSKERLLAEQEKI